MPSSYSLQNHSILPLIYRVFHPNPRTLTYFIKEPVTRSLLMFGSPEYYNEVSEDQLKDIEQLSQCQLKYSFFNSNTQLLLSNSKLSRKPEPSILKLKEEQIITPEDQGDLKPLVVGDLSVCFIDAKGYLNPYSLIAVTHLGQNSTKIPILFPGNLVRSWQILGPTHSIDLSVQAPASEYIKSLEKVKYFPKQTYIFPTQSVCKEDLIFSKAFKDSEFIQQKIALFEGNKSHGDVLIPTTVLEEKVMNPFFNSDSYEDILGTKDKNKAFEFLRKMRKQFQLK